MFRFPENDLTENELFALRELVRSGRLKISATPSEEKKLVRLRYAQRTDKGLMATDRGRERVGGRHVGYA